MAFGDVLDSAEAAFRQKTPKKKYTAKCNERLKYYIANLHYMNNNIIITCTCQYVHCMLFIVFYKGILHVTSNRILHLSFETVYVIMYFPWYSLRSVIGAFHVIQ